MDGSEIFREGLAKLLQSEPSIAAVSTCSITLEGINDASVQRPDIVLIDTKFSGINSMVISHIHDVMPDARIIILTYSKAGADFFSAIGMGVTGYLFKGGDFRNLVRTLHLVTEGELVIDPPMATLVIEALKSLDEHKHLAKVEGINNLSKHEKTILALIARDATNKEIASTLFITENTVKVHVHNIMCKLQARNRFEATVCAIEAGMLLECTPLELDRDIEI